MAYVFLSEGPQRDSLRVRTATPPHLGPGAYDTTPKRKHKRSSSAPFLSKEPRPSIITEDKLVTPGPGYYAESDNSKKQPHQKESRQSSSFASSTSRFDGRVSKSPGPGTYDLPAASPSPQPYYQQRTTPEANLWQKTYTAPSIPSSNYGYDVRADGDIEPYKPGQSTPYEESKLPERKPKGPNFAKEGKRRTLFEDVQTKAHPPGPGDYNISGKRTTQGAAAFSASAAPRFAPIRKEGSSPGPGNYDPVLEIGKKPVAQKYRHPTLSQDNGPTKAKKRILRGSIVQKKESPKPASLSTSPGPGDYAPGDMRTRKSMTFRASPRFKEKEKAENALGPGSYNFEISGFSQKGITRFSETADRFPQVPVNAPGPGYYDLEKDMADISIKPSPMFVSGTARNVFGKTDTPSPQKYTAPREWNPTGGGKFSQSTRFDHSSPYDVDEEVITPGPGAYETSVTPLPKYNRAPSPFGSKHQRFREIDSSGPGPAKYGDVHTVMEKKSYNIYLQ